MMPLLASSLVLLATQTVGPIKSPTGPVQPPVVTTLNLLANPGFENGTAGWALTGAADTGYGTTYAFQGGASYAEHRGGFASFDFRLPASGLGSVSTVKQTLAGTVSGAAVVGAAFWARCPDPYLQGNDGYVLVRIGYASGVDTVAGFTVPAAVPGPSGTGWTKLDYRSAIDPNRAVRSVAFTTYGYGDGEGDVFLDDISLSILAFR